MKIALVTNDLFAMWLFRRGLVRELVRRGHGVYILAAPDETHAKLLGKAGAVCIGVAIDRFMSLWKDLRLFFSYHALFRKNRFDVVHSFTIKPNLYAPPAARLAGVKKVICSVTGLGYIFSDGAGPGIRALRAPVTVFLKISFGLSEKVSFQNRDDARLMIRAGAVSEDKAVIIKSSGVDLERYSCGPGDEARNAVVRAEMGAGESSVVVTMVVARVAWQKGVREFAEAARILAARDSSLRFVFVGPADEKVPDAVPEEYLRDQDPAYFRWLGRREDVRDILAASDVVALPSYYREGVPRVLLEAMAMGKAVVTTDNVGCREAVDDGVTGYLVPVRDAGALADRIGELAGDERKRREFGARGRLKAEREFDERIVIKKTLDEMYGIE